LLRHGITAIGGHAGGERLDFGCRAAAQIAVDETLHFGRGIRSARKRRAARDTADLLDAGLHLIDIAAQQRDIGLERFLARDDIEARFGGIGGGGRFHSRVLFLQGTKKPPEGGEGHRSGRRGGSGGEVDPCLRLQRVGDHADLEQVDLFEHAA